jgi:hypothetical protein
MFSIEYTTFLAVKEGCAVPEYLVGDNPRQVIPVEVYGEPFDLKEYDLVAIAWPRDGNVAFVIDKRTCPRWRHAVPYLLPTPFPRFTQPGVSVARVGAKGGLVLTDKGEPPHKLIVHQRRLRLVIDLDSPEIRNVLWEMIPPDPNFVFPGRPDDGTDPAEPDITLRYERLTYLAMLQPDRWWVGRALRSLHREYLVADFDRVDMVIADCPRLGNALFSVNKTRCINRLGIEWQGIFCRTKPEIRRLDVVTRVEHKGRWHIRLNQLVSPPA